MDSPLRVGGARTFTVIANRPHREAPLQDRYAGDLGDFSKFGLLRALAGADSRIGVVWYLVPDEGHNADGKHTTYLRGRPRDLSNFRACDSHAWDCLKAVVDAGERSVSALERSGVLPANTLWFSERLHWAGVSGKTARTAHRRAWARRALAAVHPADLVCLDPDNGLQCRSVSRTAAKGPKYAFVDEIAPYVDRGQSVVIYHHANRAKPAVEQAQERSAELSAALTPGEPVRHVLFRKGSCRIYFILPAPAYRAVIDERLEALLDGPWGAHFSR